MIDYARVKSFLACPNPRLPPAPTIDGSIREGLLFLGQRSAQE